MKRMHQRGFTLLEVLLVILLMGLAASAVTMGMGGSDKKKKLEATAKQFIATTEMVLDETVLNGFFIGIIVEDTSYKYVVYDDEKWQDLTQDRLLSERQMNEGVQIDLMLDGLPLAQEDEDDESFLGQSLMEQWAEEREKFPEPQILLFPSGEMSAFELTFVSEDESGNKVTALVVGDGLGRLTLGRKDDFDHQ
ncbi:type II secretion system minor pseudopilin GspH [Shewanella sp. VB17]|uniref:type II secretion system minor pseudopilin GspH n=1 Tax=Shewanella sp. VB17 TaxID=2739432 RepID=UPI001563F84A|nr:type II secretion system minor pseudopilin GspH [Shewanella sp. VB17]NRD71991.1 type II secretion system minor pseudopilin GspH [Shewanella sp. VB17]